jgi:hypothetical protein
LLSLKLRQAISSVVRGLSGRGHYLMGVTLVDEVQPRAQAALCNSPFYELRDLQVEQCDSALLISGCVSSFYHKQLAQEVVRSVGTDIKVVNSIQVESNEGL